MSDFERPDIPTYHTFMHRPDVFSAGEEGISEGTERYLDAIDRISAVECDPVLMHLKTAAGRALGSLGLRDDRFNTYGPIIESSAADVDDRIQNAVLGVLEKVAESGYSKGSITTYANRVLQKNSRDEDILETNAPRLPQSQIDDIRKAYVTYGSLSNEAQKLQKNAFGNAEQIWQLHQWEQRVDIERGAVFFDDIHDQTMTPEVSDEDYEGYGAPELTGADAFPADILTDALAETSLMVEAAEQFLVEGPLDARQEQIVRLRFGIGVDKALSANEVGELMGIHYTRVRQILEQSLRELRRPSKHRAKVEGFAGVWLWRS
jgi:RNA polymerase sigma factor (sigma-70 family)